MKIGELSERTGVSVRSLRYYEQQGLLQPGRLTNGYRMYHTFAVEQVQTIQFYLSLGLSTEQIASFLNCVMVNKESFCKEIMPIYQQKLAEVDAQITMLTSIKSNLEDRIRHIKQEDEAQS
ncbi:MerR family transcriptional regulator [Paenibacillus baekrokdamisoli]|uniref:MerR family transcriptional regulator n=1 Tax=Paenibacillus baekrokdamisoli TaxID=1712516 RepID=A0A3G9IM02_9BACL|nr:MerR family transcriptional regulator [Paenibacillus baekrokdamisoli]MBB3067457.1 DNA-binding transcriptional MerR regulator [Paenibacillus baekrokdamisoli]BBH19356.1 MerR family transcriptional regulator [Paenibacillus baekrokdamisoli]